MRKWRTERYTKPGGTYWCLSVGRARGRIRVALGYVTADQAAMARDRIQQAEDRSRVGALLALHARDPQGLIEMLTGDGPDDLGNTLPAVAVDYGRMIIRDYHAKYYAPHREATKPRTWRTEREHWRRILDALGDVKLREIEPRLFARWIRALRVRASGVRRDAPGSDGLVPASGAYRRLLRSALQSLLTYAWEEGHVEERVRLGEIKLEGSTLPARRATDPLSLEEVAALIAAAPPVRRAMYAVGVGQGLRPGELVRVRWEDIDWTARTMAVRGTKTQAAEAVIPMTPLAYGGLLIWWESSGRPAAGMAFRALGARKDGRESSFKRALTVDARKAKIARSVTPYLLRHSFATLAWSLGIDQDVARRIMRHTDLKMLDRVYTRPRPADLVGRVAGFAWPTTGDAPPG